MFAHCRICGRKLRSSESIAEGIGPTCRKRLGIIHLPSRKIAPYEAYELDEKKQYKLFEEGDDVRSE